MASSFPQRARTVVLDEVARQQIDALLQKHGRLEDVYRGIEWAISTDPLACQEIPRTDGIRIIKTDSYPDAPALRVYFRINADDHHCTILEVHEIYVYEEED
jgi:hypothetical protein